MAWCDKLAVIWFAFLFLLALLHSGLPIAIAHLFDPTTWAVVLVPWLFLRAIDWITGGPNRRRGRIHAHIVN
jgi:hypothetical protein